MKKNKKIKKNIILLSLLFVSVLLLAFFINEQLVGRREQESIQSAVSFLQLEESREKELEEGIQGTKKILTFAVIGDIHLGAWDKSEAYLRQALKKAIDREVKFVVLIGDLTQNGTREEFNSLKEILDYSGLLFYVVPGNHDIGAEADKEGLNNFKEVFGKTDKEIVLKTELNNSEIKKIRLFLVNTAIWRGGETRVLLDSEQWLWLKRSLADKRFDSEELKLVFSQTPFEKLSTADSHWFKEFICAGFVDGLFEADLHKTMFFRRECPLPMDNEQMEKIYYSFYNVQVGTLFKPDREFPGFLTVHYFDNRFFEIERVLVNITDKNN